MVSNRATPTETGSCAYVLTALWGHYISLISGWLPQDLYSLTVGITLCTVILEFHPARWTRLSCVPGRVFILGRLVRTIVFIDGQNLYHLAKNAWAPPVGIGPTPYSYPSYDVEKLADALASRLPGRTLAQIRFYTGVPNADANLFWHDFWTNKLRYLRSQGVYTYRGRVNPSGHEKGIDVSLSIDLIRLTYEQEYEAAVIVSQDWDFGPAVGLARVIAKEQGRNPTFDSHFPYEPGRMSPRGIPGTTWFHINKATYDSCLDPRDYRPS